jgi:hypothetical protein
MMVMRSLHSSRRVCGFGAGRLLALLAVLAAIWSLSVGAQQASAQKLTLSQIEGLVAHSVPDSVLAAQIERRGLAFAPTHAIIDDLRAKGAGPLTIAAIETMIRGGANAGGTGPQGPAAAATPPYDASVPMLSKARQTIPIEVASIFRSLDDGNPQGARQFVSPDILNNTHQLDQICIPYTYRAHYIVSIVERPEDLFETRVRVLIKPFKEVAQVFWFRASNGVFVLTGVDPDQFSTEAEQAKESVRQFIFAAKGGRWDVAARYASPHLPLDPLKAPKYTAYFDKITTANASFDKTLYDGGIRLLIRVDVRGGLWYLPDFLVDPATGLIVRAFFRSPENIYSEVPDPAGVTDPDFEAYTLQRFGLEADAERAIANAQAARISVDNGPRRYTVDECRADDGKVICTGEETYLGQGTFDTSMNLSAGFLTDDHGGKFSRSDAWFGSLSGPHNMAAQLVSGVPVNCVWVYDGFTPGAQHVDLTFPNGAVLSNVPLINAARGGGIAEAPMLAQTMQLIQDTMKEQGPLDYVLTTSNRNNPSAVSLMKVHSAEYTVAADLATCTLHVAFAEDDSLETSVGGKTFAAGTYDQHSQVDTTVPFKSVEGITVESRQDSQNHSLVGVGHPELWATVAPSVFVVQLSASKPVFSAHLSTTKGSEAPQVSDKTGMLTEFLFRDEAMANRVAKAMRQAVELCDGGNKEPF